ncbi:MULTISPECIES: hypothetical protein [Arthrobacter]|uniref:DUF4190 domain-containing protein n=1 Tax=Arthrobacter caoxuetaonis TaxID=2886935 RepID=A0A9X1SB88_9MICC|nr:MULTISPECIES: hypothetical protein [Arthrobacter]MCC3282096.1 hypothetical protein [Arthrobacter caoxuetaonis]MCC3297520.1 hypothetical protein [Arthrobacter caoxuetaonis]MCC9194411.1 hypothetical protein [Arthrobacter sp. zg-Y916]USQ57949.1 hypothetical protein NF551_03595 [Arthrobacter caoxuetaonis]
MGTQPNDPMYSYGQGYPPSGVRSNQGWGLALAGLIFGVVALGMFWIPLINYLALALAVVGLGLSIAALVIAVRRGTTAKILSIAAVIVSGLAFVLCAMAIFLWGALFSSIGEDEDTTRYVPAPTVTITSPAATGSSGGMAPSSSAPSTGTGTSTGTSTGATSSATSSE